LAAVLFGSDSVATAAMLHAAEAVAPSLDVEVTGVDIHGSRAIFRFRRRPSTGW
jgi:hypothetical protein